MSVVVRMEMPENCAVCPFVTEYSRCVFLGMYANGEDGRADNCPIICQLPEGHGRLVDADAIEYLISENGCQDDVAYRYDINEMPTLVPADAESPSPKPTDPVPIRDVYYVMTECDAKTGTVKYEPRERIEP